MDMSKDSDNFIEEVPQLSNVEEDVKEKFTSDIIAMNSDALDLIAKTKKAGIDFTNKEDKN
jgi:hypothetical protein